MSSISGIGSQLRFLPLPKTAYGGAAAGSPAAADEAQSGAARPAVGGAAGGAAPGAPEKPGGTFGDLLKQVIASEHQAERATESYSRGESQGIHETMVALEKADIQFNLLVNVRNKLLDAYREVMRMS